MSVHTDTVGRNVLIIAFIINLIMITADLTYGLMMNSASLLSDAANNAGDVFILGSSIFVLSSTTVVKHKLALLKGIIMTACISRDNRYVTTDRRYYFFCWIVVINWQY